MTIWHATDVGEDAVLLLGMRGVNVIAPSGVEQMLLVLFTKTLDYELHYRTLIELG